MDPEVRPPRSNYKNHYEVVLAPVGAACTLPGLWLWLEWTLSESVLEAADPQHAQEGDVLARAGTQFPMSPPAIPEQILMILASVCELACIYLAFILHDKEVLANANVGSLICNVGASGPTPAVGAAPAGVSAPSITAVATENKVKAKKKEFEESDNDMGFGLFE
ncbi:60S acidic ribosomal protein P1-like [Panthera uncia]|uniref:60S acidic ribosomal protein P1-like n=1 Tax=Panthera uncia TaxID=29064 RepID=UPI0020FF8FCB|nr:60S acidic ribosomal protein P1-like [Panthera uncia]